jgi:hypothetical protein
MSLNEVLQHRFLGFEYLFRCQAFPLGYQAAVIRFSRVPVIRIITLATFTIPQILPKRILRAFLYPKKDAHFEAWKL